MTLLGLRCDSYIALGKFDLAEADANAMHELALSGDPELKILALRYQASVQLVKGRLVEATQTATQAVAQARALKTPNPYLLARCLYILGECYKSSGNYENAITAAKEAIPLFEMTGSLQETGRTYWLMAPSYNVLGNAKIT